MARRGREAALKRSREKSRQEKQEAKREKRSERRADTDDSNAVDEQVLMEQFARLSERHENGQISIDEFNTERERILSELGIQTPDSE